MTKEESIKIKDEILKKEGTVHIGNVITIHGAVLIKDILDIINKYTTESEE